VFGDAGATVLIEEFVSGRELSVLAITDGARFLPLPPAQDSKRVGDGDAGPNTGGMGAYSPVPFVDGATYEGIVDEVISRAIAALAGDVGPYRGVLYAGLMLTEKGPTLLEFNCRFGDPETEAILPLVNADLAEVLLAAAEGDLADVRLGRSREACVTVVVASGGYPGDHATGIPIDGLDEAAAQPDVEVFHAGTAVRDGRVVTAGGRVLAVSARGKDLALARDRAYDAVSLISFDGMHYRKDIAAVAAQEERG
jgi:phosphoribosylamine--glycine ligase